ncbi:MAG: DUF2807 domain-containing protein [Rikenellaceae bacterium]|nr:DUF2807 domain-containing protein [Rikenellaceae bacterium]
MKKQIFGLCAALALSIPAAFAGETTLTSSRGIPINGLQAGHTFAVTLRQSANTAENGVTVTIDEWLKPYLEVRLEKGILHLGFKDLPRGLQDAGKWSRPATAEVTLNRIDRLGASGLASVKPVGTFTGAAAEITASGIGKIGPITIDVTGGSGTEVNTSGMGSIENLTLKNAKGISAEANGNSHLTLDCGSVASLDIEVSGMSSATVKGGAPSTKAECGGSSKLSLDCGTIRSLDASTSGMSSITATGNADNVTAEADGSSHINLKELKTKNVTAETSGMSGITAWVTESLDADASGSSSIRYRADNKIRLSASKSGMGSISNL